MLAGVGIAPTLISGFSLVERMVPAAAVTEGLTWATTGLVVGFSVSTWLAGRLVDSAGVPWAFSVATVSGALALLSCWRRTGDCRLTLGDVSRDALARYRQLLGDRPGAPARRVLAPPPRLAGSRTDPTTGRRERWVTR